MPKICFPLQIAQSISHSKTKYNCSLYNWKKKENVFKKNVPFSKIVILFFYIPKVPLIKLASFLTTFPPESSIVFITWFFFEMSKSILVILVISRKREKNEFWLVSRHSCRSEVLKSHFVSVCHISIVLTNLCIKKKNVN